MPLIPDMTNTEPNKAPSVDPPATVWGLYNDKARFRDKALLKDWDSSINSLLLFAAIFAAVLTALCVESRKLLEQDPLSLIDQTLLYMVQRSIDPSIAPLPPRGSFEPPKWAVIVNAFFFASLTTSILAAVGSVTCLQWVDEYDAGLDAAATPKERAIRSHYRYRATRRWYMRHMIASLPIILYLAVGFFLVGLTLWFWQIYQVLAFIPLTGLLIWATGYTATTLMAVFCPSAPYRTAVSKALFRVIYHGQFYAWYYTRTAFSLYKPLLKFLRHFFSRDPWNESRNQYILEKIEFSRRMKPKLLDLFPWMPPGRDVHQSIHSHIREQGSVARDQTIHVSVLAWLASSIDLSADSAPKLRLVLVELNNLPWSKLRHWPEHNYDAPWGGIFNMVLAASIETKGGDVILHQDDRVIPEDRVVPNYEIIQTLAQILQKMSFHPTLFERMILDLDNLLLIKFMDLLKSKRPTSSTDAQRRLESITLLVSSKKWLSMSHEEQPIMPAFKVILDCLDSMQINGGDPHISTSWIFTFCYVKKVKGDERKMVTWPKPALIRFIPDAFTNKSLREHAIVLVLQFIDAVLCDTEPPPHTKWRWKWSEERSKVGDGSAAEKLVADKLVVMRLLVRHLMRIFFTFRESQQSERLFNDLLSKEAPTKSSERITNPALRLVVMAFDAHRKEVEVPPENDRIWSDPVWQYAVSVWFGFQTDYSVSNGREIFASVPPEQSARLIHVLRCANPVALNGLIRLSTKPYSSKHSRSWSRLFALIPNSELSISRMLSYPLTGLSQEQWFRLFAELQSGGDPRSATTGAMLQALQGSLRLALCQPLWQKTRMRRVPNQAQVFPPSPTTPMEGFAMDYWHTERRNRPSRSLPLDMLKFTGNVISSHQNHANFHLLRLCVYIVDELAQAYTAGSRRDPQYTRLFVEISIALQPICRRYIARPSIAPLNDQAHKALFWSAKLEDAYNNTSSAGGLPLKIDRTQGLDVRDVETESTAPGAPAKEGVLHRLLPRTQNVVVEDKV